MKKFNIFITLLLTSLSLIFAQPRAEQVTPLDINVQNNFSSTNTQSILNSSDITSSLIEINNIYRYIDANFLYEVDPDKVKEGLASGLMNSLGDEYSYYISKEDSQEYAEDTSGTYVGIGTYLTKMNPSYTDYKDPKTYMVQIVSPFPGGPADRAGIRANDLISHVNGQDISELNDKEASKLIRGSKGEPITLTIHRGDSTFDITLKPEVVTTPNLTKGVIGNNIGYIFIYSFNLQTGNLVKEAIEELLKQNIKGLIIDLRNNGGGTVDTALQIADFFIDDGPLLTIEFKEGSKNQPIRYIANEGSIVPQDLPIVILANGGTASSSEILTAALKENGRATVIGSKTFGKGIMQNVIAFLDGYIQFTYAHYLTPLNNDIHKVGIEPDILVEDIEYTKEEMASYAKFVNTSAVKDYVEKNSTYSIENIEHFAKENADSNVPSTILKLLVRNEYIYMMDYKDRPIVDTTYDEQLNRALQYFEQGK